MEGKSQARIGLGSDGGENFGVADLMPPYGGRKSPTQGWGWGVEVRTAGRQVGCGTGEPAARDRHPRSTGGSRAREHGDRADAGVGSTSPSPPGRLQRWPPALGSARSLACLSARVWIGGAAQPSKRRSVVGRHARRFVADRCDRSTWTPRTAGRHRPAPIQARRRGPQRARFCDEHRLPPPAFNVTVLGREADALWPAQRLIVELDGFAYHRHRVAFESDRARDAALLVAGYRTVRITHRRLTGESDLVAQELRTLLGGRGVSCRAGLRRRSWPSRSGFRRPSRPLLPGRPSWPGRCPRSRR